MRCYYQAISAKAKDLMKMNIKIKIKRSEGKWMNRPPVGSRIASRTQKARLAPDLEVLGLVEGARTLYAQSWSVWENNQEMFERGLWGSSRMRLSAIK